MNNPPSHDFKHPHIELLHSKKFNKFFFMLSKDLNTKIQKQINHNYSLFLL